jgi:hypothetical protein
VAQLLSTVGQQLASHATARAAAAGPQRPAVQLRDIDVVASSASDPKGMVLASALLPVTICSIIMAAAVALLLEFRPAWRQLLALIIVSAASHLIVLIGWSVLGLAAIFIGHHTPFRLAASPARKRSGPGPTGSGPAGASAVTAHA